MFFVDDPNDAFWLAQTYFTTHQYSRAERLLTRPFPAVTAIRPDGANESNHSMEVLSGIRDISHGPKGKGKEPDTHEISTSRLPMGPAGLIKLSEDAQPKVSRLVDISVACRYLAAQCQVRQGNWSDALEMLGEVNPFRHSGP